MIPIQSLNSASLMSTILSGYSSMNQIRLVQALRGEYVSSFGNGLGNFNKHHLSQQDADFLKKYQTRMTDLLSAASGVIDPGVSRLAADSANPEVAEVNGKLESVSDRYELRVERLASSQLNRSRAIWSDGLFPSIGGSLRVVTERGRFDFIMSSASADTNEGALRKFADEINAACTGVVASVVTEDGKSSLELKGEKTGAENSFTVSGTLAERLDLENTVRQGQDAVYTVSQNGGEAERFISASNTAALREGLFVDLKGTGTAMIRSGDAAALADAMERMVSRFNETLHFLNDNADRGVGVLQQMKRMVLSPASERRMERIGVDTRSDGELIFDRSVFLKAFRSSPSLTYDIAEKIAEGVRADARQGLNTASADLISSSERFGKRPGLDQDPLRFLSAYNRNGAYNLLNYYAVGSLMNINI